MYCTIVQRSNRIHYDLKLNYAAIETWTTLTKYIRKINTLFLKHNTKCGRGGYKLGNMSVTRHASVNRGTQMGNMSATKHTSVSRGTKGTLLV